MGFAQSQSRRCTPSIAHPAVKTAITLIIRQVFNVMGDLMGCAQGPNAGRCRTGGERGLCLPPPLTGRNAQGGHHNHAKRTPERCAATNGGNEAHSKGDHGVFPDR